MAEINALLLFLKQYSVLVMFIVFVLLVASVFWPGRGQRFERDSRIPLDDDLARSPRDDPARFPRDDLARFPRDDR